MPMDEGRERAQYARMRKLILLAVLTGVAACSPGKQSASQSQKTAQTETIQTKINRAKAAQVNAAHTNNALAKAADLGQSPHPVAPIVDEDLFHGWRCGGDCTLHHAGYAWGERHKITNPQDCRGKSESFIEGCWAFTGAEGPFGHKEIFQDED